MVSYTLSCLFGTNADTPPPPHCMEMATPKHSGTLDGFAKNAQSGTDLRYPATGLNQAAPPTNPPTIPPHETAESKEAQMHEYEIIMVTEIYKMLRNINNYTLLEISKLSTTDKFAKFLCDALFTRYRGHTILRDHCLRFIAMVLQNKFGVIPESLVEYYIVFYQHTISKFTDTPCVLPRKIKLIFHVLRGTIDNKNVYLLPNNQILPEYQGVIFRFNNCAVTTLETMFDHAMHFGGLMFESVFYVAEGGYLYCGYFMQYNKQLYLCAKPKSIPTSSDFQITRYARVVKMLHPRIAQIVPEDLGTRTPLPPTFPTSSSDSARGNSTTSNTTSPNTGPTDVANKDYSIGATGFTPCLNYYAGCYNPPYDWQQDLLFNTHRTTLPETQAAQWMDNIHSDEINHMETINNTENPPEAPVTQRAGESYGEVDTSPEALASRWLDEICKNGVSSVGPASNMDISPEVLVARWLNGGNPAETADDMDISH